MRGRESGAILTMMDMKETIAASLDDYVDLAGKLGLDSEWRRLISDKISANKHKIYGDRSCITGLEDFLIKAVEQRLR
jgi:protein O-GlcNAc transferase